MSQNEGDEIYVNLMSKFFVFCLFIATISCVSSYTINSVDQARYSYQVSDYKEADRICREELDWQLLYDKMGTGATRARYFVYCGLASWRVGEREERALRLLEKGEQALQLTGLDVVDEQALREMEIALNELRTKNETSELTTNIFFRMKA